MANRTLALDDRLYDYLLRHSLRDAPFLKRLRDETNAMPQRNMQIAPEQGQFMALLVELVGARRALEIGTFTGYSSTCIARAMGPAGRLVCCDISEAYTAVARRYWAEAGVADRIELKLGPALATLDGLLAGGGAGQYDFAFIDADKTNYDAYYERTLALMHPGGLIAIDNVLWDGAVADPQDQAPDTAAIRRLNDKVHADERVSASLVPIGDGLLLARKR
jgi:predicted O-methyltransferase YrrM